MWVSANWDALSVRRQIEALLDVFPLQYCTEHSPFARLLMFLVDMRLDLVPNSAWSKIALHIVVWTVRQTMKPKSTNPNSCDCLNQECCNFFLFSLTTRNTSNFVYMTLCSVCGMRIWNSHKFQWSKLDPLEWNHSLFVCPSLFEVWVDVARLNCTMGSFCPY